MPQQFSKVHLQRETVLPDERCASRDFGRGRGANPGRRATEADAEGAAAGAGHGTRVRHAVAEHLLVGVHAPCAATKRRTHAGRQLDQWVLNERLLPAGRSSAPFRGMDSDLQLAQIGLPKQLDTVMSHQLISLRSHQGQGTNREPRSIQIGPNSNSQIWYNAPCTAFASNFVHNHRVQSATVGWAANALDVAGRGATGRQRRVRDGSRRHAVRLLALARPPAMAQRDAALDD